MGAKLALPVQQRAVCGNFGGSDVNQDEEVVPRFDDAADGAGDPGVVAGKFRCAVGHAPIHPRETILELVSEPARQLVLFGGQHVDTDR